MFSASLKSTLGGSENTCHTSGFSTMVTLEITIPIASTWPTREELNAQNAVESALVPVGIGKCTGAGGGMGQMDLTYRVDDDTQVPAAQAHHCWRNEKSHARLRVSGQSPLTPSLEVCYDDMKTLGRVHKPHRSR